MCGVKIEEGRQFRVTMKLCWHSGNGQGLAPLQILNNNIDAIVINILKE